MATTTRTQHVHTRPATLARVLLHRRATVYPGRFIWPAHVEAERGVDLLEVDLAERGWLLSADLRASLLGLDTVDLVAFGAGLLADCDALTGADRDHTPLFRGFPDRVPADTLALFVERVLSALFQHPEQPCVLCFTVRAVQPVNPCGHLVCTECFRPEDYSACPICYRALDPADPFLTAAPAPTPAERRPVDAPGPARLRVLHLGRDMAADARDELLSLLARPTALPPGEADDLGVLLAAADRADLSWLPARIPGRETKARLLAWLLDDPTPAALDAVTGLLDTATDVLRLLVARSGGESLIDRPRIAPVARPLRRALLAALDRITVVQLVEDMRRHRRAWIAVGERLHPGEYAHRWPRPALAFAVLRGTDLDRHPAGRQVTRLAADQPVGLWVENDRLRVACRGRRVEEALADGRVRPALVALFSRPGELLRRADHLLRVAGREHRDEVVTSIAAAAATAAPAVLLSTLGALRTRHAQQFSRVFFPAGRTGTAHVIPDNRPTLPLLTVGQAVGAVGDAILTRAAALPQVDVALVDRALDGVIAPFAERTASRALVTLPRGSMLPIPDGKVVRLFLHWMEAEERVDLDLSVAVYDDTWQHIGTCDYTSLHVPGAVHSGDFTSAPAPRGASEFIDLDVARLAAEGGRYAVMSVFSFNSVPFTGMAEAFAGFMVRDQLAEIRGREPFDARAVEQRFDLTGPGKATIPLVVDLRARTMRWLDVAARVTGTNHSIGRHSDQLAEVAGALVASFEAGNRVTLGELGRYIAAARAREVLVRDGDKLAVVRRRDGESVKAFANRLRDEPGVPVDAEVAGMAALQFLGRADLPVPDGAEVFALHRAGLDAGRVRLLAAADVPAMLA